MTSRVARCPVLNKTVHYLGNLCRKKYGGHTGHVRYFRNTGPIPALWPIPRNQVTFVHKIGKCTNSNTYIILFSINIFCLKRDTPNPLSLQGQFMINHYRIYSRISREILGKIICQSLGGRLIPGARHQTKKTALSVSKTDIMRSICA